MAATGTYAYGPATSNLMLTAFNRCLIRRTEITAQHLADAENEANLVQVEWSSRQPNLWTTELYTTALTEGTATYTLPARMIAIQAAYLSIDDGSGSSTDQILWALSTFEFSAIPDKTQEAVPNSYWYDRTITPQITLWPVPNEDDRYTLNLRILHQIQDASLASGTTLDLPYRWLDAWVSALAARLADLYPDALIKSKGPGAITDMWAKAERAWKIAATEDQERVPMYLQPQTYSYWR